MHRQKLCPILSKNQMFFCSAYYISCCQKEEHVLEIPEKQIPEQQERLNQHMRQLVHKRYVQVQEDHQ